MYSTKVKRTSPEYTFVMPEHIEEIAKMELSNQPYGGILTLKEYPKLHILAPTMTYEGSEWTAQRRIVDQLDQVTFCRMK